MGHKAKESHSRETRSCFNWSEGHLASVCREGPQKGAGGLAGMSSNHYSANVFSFGAFTNGICDYEAFEMLNDSEAVRLIDGNMQFFSSVCGE